MRSKEELKMTEEDLRIALEKALDNSTLFCRVRNALNTLLVIAEKADDAEILDIYERAELLQYNEVAEILENSYELFYNIFEKAKGDVLIK